DRGRPGDLRPERASRRGVLLPPPESRLHDLLPRLLRADRRVARAITQRRPHLGKAAAAQRAADAGGVARPRRAPGGCPGLHQRLVRARPARAGDRPGQAALRGGPERVHFQLQGEGPGTPGRDEGQLIVSTSVALTNARRSLNEITSNCSPLLMTLYVFGASNVVAWPAGIV